MTWDIMRLGASDVAVMRAVNTLFAEAFAEEATYQGKPPSDAYLSEMLLRSDVIALAACDANRVLGGLVAYVLPKLEQERSEVYIYDLAVDEAARRKGIARAMIKKVQVIAAEVGAWVIYVQADDGDEPAVTLYTSVSTREDVLHFDIPPADEA